MSKQNLKHNNTQLTHLIVKHGLADELIEVGTARLTLRLTRLTELALRLAELTRLTLRLTELTLRLTELTLRLTKLTRLTLRLAELTRLARERLTGLRSEAGLTGERLTKSGLTRLT